MKIYSDFGRREHACPRSAQTARLDWWLIITALLAFSSAVSWAQTPDPVAPGPPPDPDRPHLSVHPQEEDFTFLSDRMKRSDFWDPIKFVSLSRDRGSSLSFGLEYRGEYENFRNALWGAGVQDGDGYGLERVMPHVDIRIHHQVRVFTELQFDNIFGRNGGPRPGIDEDRGDVHQAFAEVGKDLHDRLGPSLRLGRQELVFGSGRLLDDNEGVNVKFAFDGIRLTHATPHTHLDLFAVKPIEINPGFFDDSPDHSRSLWGIYGTAPVPGASDVCADLYYIGYDSKKAAYELGAGREIRHSVGVRLFNREPGQPPMPGPDFNWEAVVQWGALGANSVHAWTGATETGYTFRGASHIRLAIRADAASGTQDESSHTLGTFNALFPRGAYFGPKLFLAGPSNFIDLHPLMQLSPRRDLSVSAEWVFFWRESTNDGLYSPTLTLLKTGLKSDARFIGSQPNLEVRWAIDPHVTAVFNIAGFFTGKFLAQSPPAGGVAFGNGGLTYRF